MTLKLTMRIGWSNSLTWLNCWACQTTCKHRCSRWLPTHFITILPPRLLVSSAAFYYISRYKIISILYVQVVKMKKLFVTAFKDLYVSQVPKNPFVIPPALTRSGACAFTRDLRFTPPLCDYSRSPSTWDLQFSSASQLGASTRIKSFGLSSKLKKKEQ